MWGAEETFSVLIASCRSSGPSVADSHSPPGGTKLSTVSNFPWYPLEVPSQGRPLPEACSVWYLQYQLLWSCREGTSSKFYCISTEPQPCPLHPSLDLSPEESREDTRLFFVPVIAVRDCQLRKNFSRRVAEVVRILTIGHLDLWA